MNVATRLKWFLDSHGAEYDTLSHAHSGSSLDTAKKARVAPDLLAKSVLLEDERGYLLAVLPSTRRISLREIRRQLGRKMELATEGELGGLFGDCEPGAVPPMGPAYGLPVLIDDTIEGSDLYFESGNHEDLIHMKTRDFLMLLDGARRGLFSELEH